MKLLHLVVLVVLVVLVSFCAAASIQLGTGDCLQLSCDGKQTPNNWVMRQDQPSSVLVVSQAPTSNYTCVGPFLKTDPNATIQTCRDGISIDENEGQRINITNIHPSDAGTYVCRRNTSELTSTDVVVVNRDSLAVHIENTARNDVGTMSNAFCPGDVIQLSCSIQYAGSQSPSMKLVILDSKGDERRLTNSNSSAAEFKSDQLATVKSDYTVLTEDRNLTVICSLPFVTTSSVKTTAVYIMVCGPRFSSSEQKSTVYVSNGSAEELNCHTEFYPATKYEWFRVENETSPSSIVGAENDTYAATALGHYRCTVTNLQDNKMASKVFTVERLVSLRRGDSLQLACSRPPNDWVRLQNVDQPPNVVVVFLRETNNYACAGPFQSKGGSLCRDGVSIDVDQGRSMTISAVDRTDAGIYMCSESPFDRTNVVVTESVDHLQLSHSASCSSESGPIACKAVLNAIINLNCSIRYGGSQSPSVQLAIRHHDGTEEVLTTSNGRHVVFSEDQWATITHNHNASTAERNFTAICRLPYFNPVMSKEHHFFTVFGPVLVDPETNAALLVSAVLNCSVDAYRTVQYTWFRVGNGKEILVEGEKTESITVHTGGTYRCVVTNPENSNETSKRFFVTTSDAIGTPITITPTPSVSVTTTSVTASSTAVTSVTAHQMKAPHNETHNSSNGNTGFNRSDWLIGGVAMTAILILGITYWHYMYKKRANHDIEVNSHQEDDKYRRIEEHF